MIRPTLGIFFSIEVFLFVLPPSLQWNAGRRIFRKTSTYEPYKTLNSPRAFPSSTTSVRLWDSIGNPESESPTKPESKASILKSYEYDGWKLTYRTIDESEGLATDQEKNVLLIHPVGIGLASWFWEPFLACIGQQNESSRSKIRAYAPNLIGCGISEGSDAWDPDQRGLFMPLGWVKGCEAFWNHIEDKDFDRRGAAATPRKWTVVAQGGLAPIGVLLAARNPERIEKLILTSPPIWKDMIEAAPQEELERNYSLFRSPILGKLLFFVFEQRWLIEFFSNQFLFSENCDDIWLDKTEDELCEAARPPVQVFNSGLLLNRGLGPELKEDIQHKIPELLVVQGEGDKRPREEYVENLKNCRLITLPGTNVVPWECPEALLDLV